MTTEGWRERVHRRGGQTVGRWTRLALSAAMAAALLVALPAAPARAEDPALGSVTGTITGAGGHALSAVWVWLAGSGDPSYAESDGNGEYTFTDVPAGTYTVSASAAGYLDTYYAATGSTWQAAAADTVTVTGDASITADITMVKGVTVIGTVTIGGEPASWAEVRTADGRYYAGADADGAYAMQVPPGEVTLTVSKCLGDWTSTKDVPVTGALDDTVTVNVDLSAGTGITGSLTVPVGSPKVTVALYRVNGDVQEQVDTRSVYGSGSYTFRPEAPGDYQVRFRSAATVDACLGGAACTTVTVADDALVQVGETPLTARPAGAATGRILDGADAPIAGATVVAVTANGSVTTSTATDGSYRLPDLASGATWWLSYRKDGYLTRGGTVTVGPGVTKALPEVHLVANGSLRGTLRGADGATLGEVGLRFDSVDSTASFPATTGSDGGYDLPVVPPGHYRAWIEGAAGYLDAYHPGVLDERDATVIAVGEGVLTTADLATVKPASLTGEVALPGGATALGIATLGKRNDRLWSRSVDIAGGRYVFDGLAAGDYTVAVSVDGYPTQSVDGGAAISVPAATAASARSLTLVPDPTAVLVTGTLTAGGIEVDEAVVTLIDGDDEYTANTANGFFALHAPPGSYQVEVTRGDTTVCGPQHSSSCTTAPVTVDDTGAAVTVSLPELAGVSGLVSGPGGPVADAAVTLVDARGATVATTTTIADGTYALAWLPPGGARLSVTAAGLVPHTEQRHLTAGPTTCDVALAGFLTISGTLALTADEDDDDWVRVLAVDASNTTAATTWLTDRSAGEHAFTLDGLPPGSYRVGVQASGGRWQWYSETGPAVGTPINLTTTSVDDLPLSVPPKPAQVRISGQLIAPADDATDPDAPPTYPAVTLLNLTSEQSYPATVSDTGHYSAKLPAGSYRLRVEASHDLKTSGQSEKVTLDCDRSHDITLAQGGALAGRVTDAAGVGLAAAITASGNGWQRTTDTDAWGYWRIETVPVGGVKVHADPAGNYSPAVTTTSVTAAQTITTNQRLAAAGRIVVTVPSVAGLEHTGIAVVVTDADGAELARDVAFAGDTTSIDELPVGEVRVRFQAAGLRTLWWPEATTIADASPVAVVAAGSPTVISAPVQAPDSADDGTISGTITNPTDVAGSLAVSLVAVDGTETTTPVAGDGTYQLTVVPGNYQLRAAVCSDDWVDGGTCLGVRQVTWYGGNESPTTVIVAPAATVTGIDVPIGGKFAFGSLPCPSIAGSALVGITLRAAEGAVTPVPDELSWQWLRNGVAIAGATTSAHQVVEADLGTRLSVRVTASRDGYLTQTAESAATAIVARPVVVAGSVAITGVGRRPDDRLEAVVLGWPSAASVSYQWLRNGVAINQATSSSYVIVDADVFAAISVVATGSLPGHDPISVSSASVGPMVARLLLTKGAVKVAGTARVTRKLIATMKKWKPSGITFRYQWYRDGKAIPGAIRSTYRVVKADKRHRLRVRVTATKLRYRTLVVTSAKTSKVR